MERWLPVVGFEGRYEVSDLGRVRSLDRVVLRRRGQGRRPQTLVPHSVKGRVLKPGVGDRYPLVRLSGRSIAIHILVLSAFCGPCPDGMESCHGDSDTLNCRLDNLRWDTRLANNEDRRKRGTIPRGEKHGRAVLTENDVHEIRRLEGHRSQRQLARDFGVCGRTVGKIQRRILWPHLNEARP